MIWEIIFWLFFIPLVILGLHKLFKYSAIGIPFIRKNKKLYWVFMIGLILLINYLVNDKSVITRLAGQNHNKNQCYSEVFF